MSGCRSESTDSGTFFDMTPPNSATQNSAQKDLTYDLPEETEQPITARLADGDGGHVENDEQAEKSPVKFTIGVEVESAHEATETER